MPNKKVDRASQFMSFMALKGYFQMCLAKQKIIEEKRVLLEDKADEINQVLNRIKVGNLVRVTYYLIDHYTTFEGLCSKLDLNHNSLVLVKKYIPINDIIDITIVKEHL